jgi:hypothetical protein
MNSEVGHAGAASGSGAVVGGGLGMGRGTLVTLTLDVGVRLGATVKSFQALDELGALGPELGAAEGGALSGPGAVSEEGPTAPLCILITKVAESGAAERFGLAARDRLLLVGGRPVESFEHYQDVLGLLRDSRPLELTFASTGALADDGFEVISLKSRQQRALERQERALLSGDVELVRRVSKDGLTERLRPVFWRVLLNYLPADHKEWPETLVRQRALYREYQAEFLQRGLPEGATGDSRPHRLKGQGWWEQDLVDPKGGSKARKAEGAAAAAACAAPAAGAAAAGAATEPAAAAVTGSEETASAAAAAVPAPAATRIEAQHEPPPAKEVASDPPRNTGLAEPDSLGAGEMDPLSYLATERASPLDSSPLTAASFAEQSAARTANRAALSPRTRKDLELHEHEVELRETIWKDVQRTHPGWHFFADARCEIMERILFIYAKLNPGVEYVQGMNEVVAPILFVFGSGGGANSSGGGGGGGGGRGSTASGGSSDDSTIGSSGSGDSSGHALAESGYSPEGSRSLLELSKYAFEDNYEADTFFCFCNLMGDIRDVYMQGMDSDHGGIRGRGQALMELVDKIDPPVFRHLSDLEVNPQFFALRWITTLLSRELLLPDTVRLWDSLFADPTRFGFLLEACAAMVGLQRGALLAADFAGCLQILQKYPPTELDDILAATWEVRAAKLGVPLDGPRRLGPPPSQSQAAAAIMGEIAQRKSQQLLQGAAANLSSLANATSDFFGKRGAFFSSTKRAASPPPGPRLSPPPAADS